MSDQQPILQVNRNVPGIVALFATGDGEGARALVQAALAETHPAILVMEIWQFTTGGWVELATRAGAVLELEAIEEYWTALALATLARSDDDQGE